MSKLKLLPLGGMGGVTQNMYLYQYEKEILIVDCGIGFPDMYMPGVDTLIPDISYLQDQVEQGAKIVGMILSHGHDDHIGALPYLLEDLPVFPIYGSPLTAGFARDRLSDKKLDREIQVVDVKKTVRISDNFSFELIAITHSVPDTRHIVIDTPAGRIYHGSDFKLDKHPVDGVMSDFEEMKKVASEGNGIKLALLDCLRVERESWTGSESEVGPAIEEEMQNIKGKVLVTLMSSHVHRIQQVIDACQKIGRKVVFVGRSVEQNVVAATLLKKLHIPEGLQVAKEHIDQVPDNQLCVIIAGSQGQEGSSLVRAVYGDHRIIQISPQDKVIFSANVIPGNEINYYAAIDELSANGVDVVYPEIKKGIHNSGHASRQEQREMVEILKAEYLMPIGGANRHRALFKKTVATDYDSKHVLLPDSGQVLGIDEREVKVVDEVVLNAKAVDGLGIGDVGPIVLSDRLSLSKSGIIVLILPKVKGKLDLSEMKVISRGFVFMKEADEVIQFIKQKTAEIVDSEKKNIKDDDLKKQIEKRLARRLYKVIRREPMIVPVIFET